MIRVGIGGWNFPPWRGTFYPPGLTQARELGYASRQLTTIEINSTFYGAQRPESFRRWAAETPDDFVFSVKGPRFATNRTRLAEAGPSVERFFASGVLELGSKLGPVLWQLAATKKFEAEDLAGFLDLLPREIDGRPIRHVLEGRHDSFRTPEAVRLLRDRRIPLVFADSDRYPAIPDVTGDFVYARLQRCVEEETTGYAPAALDHWAKRFRVWQSGGQPNDLPPLDPDTAAPAGPRQCFVYFISGAKVRAPAAATALLQRLTESTAP